MRLAVFVLMGVLVMGATMVGFLTRISFSDYASDPSKDTSVDGTHPSDWGYMYWAKSIEKPVLKILKKYGIR